MQVLSLSSVTTIFTFLLGTGMTILIGWAAVGLIRKSTMDILKTTIESLEAANGKYEKDLMDMRLQMSSFYKTQHRAELNSQIQSKKIDILNSHNKLQEAIIASAFETFKRLDPAEADKMSTIMAAAMAAREQQELELRNWEGMMRAMLDNFDERDKTIKTEERAING